MELSKAQLQAIAVANAKKKKSEAVQAQVQQRYASTRLPSAIPEEPMADPLMVSDSGIEATESQKTGVIRSVFQGLTFGTSDEAEAALRSIFGEETYDANRDKIRSEMKQFETENPGAAITGEIIGGLMTPASLLKAPEVIARLGLWTRGAVKGFTGGFAYGVGTGEGGASERINEGLLSGGVGMIIGAPLERLIGTVGGTKLKGAAKRQSVTPTAESLRTFKNEAYAAVPQDKFAIGPGEIKEIFNRSNAIAAKEQHVTIPKAPSVVDEAGMLFKNYFSKGQGMSLGQAEAVRRRLFKLAEDPKNGYIVRQMIDEFDNVVDDAMGASGLAELKIAREANRRYRNVQLIEESFNKIETKGIKKSDAYAKVAQKILSNKNATKFFKETEMELLEQLANKTASDKLLRTIGKFEFSGAGLTGAMHVLAVSKAPFMLLAYAGGAGARKVLDKQTHSKLNQLIKEAGGIDAVRKVAENPNQLTMTVGGVTANDIQEALFGEE